MQHVCALSDVTPGEGLRITSVVPPIAVFVTEDGDVHAVDDTCTHQDASLADGWLEDCWIECPLHASRFNLLSGAVDQAPAKRPIRVHEVDVRDGEIWVALSAEVPHLPPGVTYEAG